MSWVCLAQEKELKATIETNDGMKIEGYVLIRNSRLNNELISFRNNTTKIYQVYHPKDLKNYTLDGDLYESHVLDSTLYFFFVIVKGKASLYELSAQKKRYYIQMQDEDKVYWLRHEKMEVPGVDGYQKTVKMVSYYKEILQRKLVDCPSLNYDKQPHPTEKELKDYVSSYNSCFSGNSYEKKELEKELSLGMSAGVSRRASNYFSIGATLDFKNPRKKLLLTSLIYNYTRWEELSYDYALKKDVMKASGVHWISYRANITLLPGKVIEPYFLLDTSTGIAYESGFGIGLIPFYFWSGGGLKINFGKYIFSRATYVFPIALRDTPFPSSFNFSLSFRVK